MQFKPLCSKTIIISLLLSGCQTTKNELFLLESSYLEEKGAEYTAPSVDDKRKVDEEKLQTSSFEYFPNQLSELNNSKQRSNLNKFSDDETLQISADSLAVKDFLHHVFGELLGVSYILGDSATSDTQEMTLNIQKPISQRKLFSLSEELLNQKGYIVRYNDDIYYIHKTEQGGKANVAYGYGNSVSSVPETASDIIQYVPFKYGTQYTLVPTLNQLFNVQVGIASANNALSIKGKRAEVLKALDFIQMLDIPSLANKQIASYQPVYHSVKELTEDLQQLLEEEGISATSTGESGKAVSFVMLERAGKLVTFANEIEALKRVEKWVNVLDKPSAGNDRAYHIYQPQFARATDVGQSLQLLISGSPAVSNRTSAESENNNTNSQRQGALSASNKDLKMVVDERSNSLIIESSGEKYRQILPLIKRLDVMPKQVMLEVVIAEVQLNGKFSQGVNFTLRNDQSANIVGAGKFNVGGAGLNYILKGANGEIALNMLQTDTNLEILSRPSIVVRDGVTASIVAGDDIPTVGKIVTDPVNGSQTSIEYRKTGVQLSVTPTINAQGVVIMEISQRISSTSPTSSELEGAPIVAERTIETEVVAESGQTVVLGGLMRENNSINDRRVPGFSSIPILGKLFDSTETGNDKVELIVMVTPKIIESAETWKAVKKEFMGRFQYLKVND
ncbi:hypothetical protein PA25_03670 [Pseudoalteromonas sp. A25]|uniref:secretin N-terminal domain-containing protein n=1 Tax=Pseudoalteromonas sp. A25 TaxID=116092 RepID=UPI001260A872|nr:secretin N-terminal domain-containing protein [Pseudoalteromonas sp. A25]BBN80382.1 hypothetical protein PA25_03670 [Pseudoalteromonas sp. A25]